MPYDLFISYSRKDNELGRITELKTQIEADYLRFANEELKCFFDITDIGSMDDWRHRILEGLRDANLLLLVLSPSYLNSPYCEWEIVEFLKYEHSRSVGGQGVTPVYFVDIPGLDDPDFEQRAAAWVAKVRRRNQVDLRPWYDEGAAALKRADVRNRLDDLERSLRSRVSKLRRLREAPGNLPGLNPRFVGREVEMQRLHEAAGLGRFGVLTAVQGIGGVGKTALAIQYAYAYADFYSGGRWIVGCAGESNLASAIRRLELDLGVSLNEGEKRDDALAARRILAELERRAIEGARSRFNETDRVLPKSLLILDNVDAPALLQPPEFDLLTGRQWLHVLATTRRGPEEFGNDSEQLTLLSIDELPEDDAVRLIESYQPGGSFPSQQERDSAHELVKLVGGFTLAVEVVAVHLGERAGRVTCAAFLERIKKEGFKGLEGAALATKGGIKHGEKLFSLTLMPTLDLLSKAERLVLDYAALLPPDAIPLPWLRAIIAADYPEIDRDADPGFDDPWLSLVNRLLGLRLLQTVDLAEDGRTPRLVRMHRLVGELMSSTARESALLSSRMANYLTTRCNAIENVHHLHQWEVSPLISYANRLLDQHAATAPKFVRALCQWLPAIDNGRYSEAILRASLSEIEEHPTGDPVDLSATLSNLGWTLRYRGRYGEAEQYLRRALDIDEHAIPIYEDAVRVRCVQLAQCLGEQGKLAEAEPFCRRALAISERVHGPNHQAVGVSLGTLAWNLEATNRLAEAEPLMRRALEIAERNSGPNHPDVARALGLLASLLRGTNRFAEAEPLMRRALAINEQCYGTNHPEVASRLSSLALLLQATNRLAEAEPLMRRALAINEQYYGTNHPQVASKLHSLALLLQATNRLAEAEPLMRRALAIGEQSFGNNHPKVATMLNNIALLLKATNRLCEAEPLIRRAIAIDEQSYRKDLPLNAVHLWTLASILLGTTRLAEAEPLMKRAVAIFAESARTTGYTDPSMKSATKAYRSILVQMGLSAEEVKSTIRDIAPDMCSDEGSANVQDGR